MPPPSKRWDLKLTKPWAIWPSGVLSCGNAQLASTFGIFQIQGAIDVCGQRFGLGEAQRGAVFDLKQRVARLLRQFGRSDRENLIGEDSAHAAPCTSMRSEVLFLRLLAS